MSFSISNIRLRIASLGPGLLYAGAAVGVSHLVQSTRAGADFGFQLLLVVLIVNVIKYPVFEIGPRYAAATGETLLDGYRKLGSWAVVLYSVVTIATMFIVMAAISIVTAGLFAKLFDLELEPPFIAVILMAISMVILGIGHYRLLDRMMKVIIVLLTISTVIAVIFGAFSPSATVEGHETVFDFGNRAHMLFLVALIGWMPAPIDLSIWHSVWTISKHRSKKHKIDFHAALVDFKLGYWGTTLIAVCFLSLGALVMYGTGNKPSEQGVEFASQVMKMYTINLGEWAYPLIAIAASTTMFSTLLTCLDAFPRTLRKATKLLIPVYNDRQQHTSLYWFWIFVTVLGSSVVLLNLWSNMRQMVDIATTMSFVVAPILAILNFVVMKRYVPKEMQQSQKLELFNKVSIAALCLFSVGFLIYQYLG